MKEAKFREQAQQSMKQSKMLGLDRSATRVMGDECEKPKPDPCPYLTACQRLKVDPQQCMVVEDSPSGAKAEVAAGAWVVGILSGQSETTLRNAGCHMIIQDMDDPKLRLSQQQHGWLADIRLQNAI